MACNSLFLNYDGSNPDMAHLKISKHHYTHIAAGWFACGILAFKGAVIYKDHPGSHYYHAFGTATICIGVLFTTGF